MTTDEDDGRPKLADKGRGEALERQRRQAEALRANLARRKTQARARMEQDEIDPGGIEPNGDESAAPKP